MEPARHAQPRRRPPCQRAALCNLNGLQNRLDHGGLPVRNDRDANVDRNDFLNKLQLWDLNNLQDQHLRNLHDPHTKDKDHLVSGLQLRNLHGQLDSRHHGDLLLQHDRDGEDLVDKLRLWDNDGHVSNLVQELIDTCPRTLQPPPPPTTHAIWEPTLGLPGAA